MGCCGSAEIGPAPVIPPPYIQDVEPLREGMDPGAKVLVTGASGYIAAHIIKILLESGYKVRGTVRDPTNEQKCKPIKDLVPSKVGNLELVKADLTDSVEKWIPVVKDCKYVLHVASPFPHKEPRNPEEVIQPAVDGTLVVMKACAQNTVKRCVVTSSGLAIMFPKTNKAVLDESDWTDPDLDLTAYERSKLMAEKAAWDYYKSLDGNKFEFAVVNPGYVMGPMLHKSEFASMDLIRDLMTGKIPMLPDVKMPLADVRDVAKGHVIAMTHPKAVNERTILTNEMKSAKDFADILRVEFGPKGYNLPTRMAPKFLFVILSWFQKDLKMLVRMWGRDYTLSNQKMREAFGIRPCPGDRTIIDTAQSLIDNGFIPLPKK